ncbi:hypothetical protein PoB_002179200 [Plakobranchus ocellatus]|uniref:Uncharacterized protein n=1 Tax=Plakobranchus ocellatus TaxID=259542 RepID=A0AAV3ZL72_9GAST|nr:hypothetical protein PoB_002179200 [Plakobranchus ocellatus]
MGMLPGLPARGNSVSETGKNDGVDVTMSCDRGWSLGRQQKQFNLSGNHQSKTLLSLPPEKGVSVAIVHALSALTQPQNPHISDL